MGFGNLEFGALRATTLGISRRVITYVGVLCLFTVLRCKHLRSALLERVLSPLMGNHEWRIMSRYSRAATDTYEQVFVNLGVEAASDNMQGYMIAWYVGKVYRDMVSRTW